MLPFLLELGSQNPLLGRPIDLFLHSPKLEALNHKKIETNRIFETQLVLIVHGSVDLVELDGWCGLTDHPPWLLSAS